jgi:hypothetical protein
VYLSGDFHNQKSIAGALRDLQAIGFSPEDLEVFSNEPLEFPQGLLDRRSHMSFAVVLGAITFCLLIIGFVYFTQYNYPIVTGGMPIFSFWSTGVIFYELTMFGAIVTTFFWFLGESGLLRRRSRRPPAPALEPGVIALTVRCRPDQADAARRSLESAGAGDVKTIGEAA